MTSVEQGLGLELELGTEASDTITEHVIGALSIIDTSLCELAGRELFSTNDLADILLDLRGVLVPAAEELAVQASERDRVILQALEFRPERPPATESADSA